MHPAKLGWHSTGHRYGAPIWGPNASIAQLQMFDGFMSATVYRNAFKYIAKTYFTQPNYYRAPTKLPNGSTAECCLFSFYQPESIGVDGSGAAAGLMDDFRAEVRCSWLWTCSCSCSCYSCLPLLLLPLPLSSSEQDRECCCRLRRSASACT